MKKILDRRRFIQQAGCAALGTTTLWNTMLNLKGVNALANFNSSNTVNGQYRALVCVLLGGGSDSHNMLMPVTSDEYDIYATTRTNLAVPNYDPNDPDNQVNIRPLGPTDDPANPPQFGVHPAMSNMQQLFNDGKLTFINNVGTLIEPVEKQNLYSGLYDLPLGLFSHIDQVAHWQTAIPQERLATGWGGKMADLMIAANEQENISMNMTFSGSNIFQTGENTISYALDSDAGSIGLTDFGGWQSMEAVRQMGVNSIIDATYQDIFKKTYMNTMKTARDGHNTFSAAFENAYDFQTQFGMDYLGRTFETIAKTISVQSQLQMNRQVFFVELGGWDHHDGLGEDFYNRLSWLDSALSNFESALQEINMFDCVTTFSISEFARTLSSNGNGSDHAWGGNMFVMGGAVNGNQMYGDYPILELNGPLEIGGGVLIPTMSADVYFAEIAKWFGVMNSDLNYLFPNLPAFYDAMSGTPPVGFLNL